MQVRNFVGLSRGMMQMKNRDQLRESAEARFKKAEIKLKDRNKATAEYEAAGLAVTANTARLRELRLARDAADAEAARAEPAKPLPTNKRKSRKASA